LPTLIISLKFNNTYRDFDKNRELEELSHLLRVCEIGALNCASLLREGEDIPIFFASDSHLMTRDMTFKSMNKAYNVVSPVRNTDPLHIDRDDGWPGSKPEDFFNVFEDLLIMGGSRAVAYGMGSFGSFGAAISVNPLNIAVHRDWTGMPIKCPNEKSAILRVPLNTTFTQTFGKSETPCEGI